MELAVPKLFLSPMGRAPLIGGSIPQEFTTWSDTREPLRSGPKVSGACDVSMKGDVDVMKIRQGKIARRLQSGRNSVSFYVIQFGARELT
jgi:hypothetical protein